MVGRAPPYRSVEVLVFGVKGGDANVDDSHSADGAMTAAGLDEDGGEGLYRHDFAIELHAAIAFEDKVDLGELLVVVHAGVFGDLNYVQCCRGIFRAEKGPLGEAARAFDYVNLVKPCYHVICHALDPKPKTIEIFTGPCIFCRSVAI